MNASCNYEKLFAMKVHCDGWNAAEDARALAGNTVGCSQFEH